MKKIFLLFLSVTVAFFSGWNLNYFSEKQKQNFNPEYALSVAEIWLSARDLYGGFGRLDENFDWDAICKESFFRAGKADSEYQYYLELCQLMATLEDGHTFILPENDGLLGVLPLKMRYINGEYYVTAIIKSHSLPLYSKLLEINGIDAHQYLEENIAQYIGIHTPLSREQHAINFFTDCGELLTDIKLTFETPDGNKKEYVFRYDRSRYNMNFSAIEQLPAEGEILYESDIFLLISVKNTQIDEKNLHLVIKRMDSSLEEFKNELINSILPYISNANGCILDYRYCNGGNSFNGLMTLYPFVPNETIQSTNTGFSLYTEKNSKYMYNALLTEQNALLDKHNNSIEERYDETIEVGKQMLQNRNYYVDNEGSTEEFFQLCEDIPKIDTPVVILLDHNTGSAVDTTVLTANAWKLVTIGTNTGGYTGNLAIISLNNGYLTGFSVPRRFGPDGQDVQNNGAVAKIHVDYDIEDLQKNIDTMLEKAIETLSEQ